MKLRNLFIGCIMSLGVLSRGEPAKTDFFFRDKDSVVFLGDSITQQRLYTTYIEAYTLTRFPEKTFTFRNVGWAGDTSWLRQRFSTDENDLFAATGKILDNMVTKAVNAGLNRDVLPLKPTVVTINFGMNDHAYQAFRPDIFRAYICSQTELVDVLKKTGARVALLTPQPIEVKQLDPDTDVRNESLRKFSDGLKELATEKGVLFVDQFDPYMAIIMKAHAETPNALIGGGNAVHPGPVGHTLMAWTILKGLHAPALVSCAGFDVTKPTDNMVTCDEQCVITHVTYTSGSLTFDRMDKALPMPIDARAVAALQLAPVTDDLNCYMLKISGLKAAVYDVFINDVKIITLTKEDLAKGFNLATVTTPCAQQAMEVLDLIFKKNDLYFQRWRRIQLANRTPERLPEFDKKIADLETLIDAARKPKTLHFSISPAVQ